MQYTAMRGSAQYRVEVPQLSGGVNLSDLPTQVEDNQLTELENMWWYQGALRTRPGLELVTHNTIPTHELFGRNVINERETVCVENVGGWFGHAVSIRANEEPVDLGSFELFAEEPGAVTVLAVKTADDVTDTINAPYLFFVSTGQIFHGSRDVMEYMSEAQPYIPWVTVEQRGEDGEPKNVTYESYNMLTGDFRSTFSTDGERTDFTMPFDDLTKGVVTVKLTLCDFETMETRTLTSKLKPKVTMDYAVGSIEGLKKREIFPDTVEDGDTDATYEVALTFDWVLGTLTAQAAVTSSGEVHYYPLPAVTSNNLEVTANKTIEGQRDVITGATRSVWFSGTRSGLSGGTRLFVTGNPAKPNLVHWSDVNKPLYFPESNHFYVGDGDQAITALAKQGELLVIFKEHEIYCTQYVAGSGFTSEDLISGRVTDIAALAAQFPLTPIHPNIGCDCPDTIQLVNNRLVWATSDAHVYMLPNVNQYSERNVRDITACVRRQLEKHTPDELKAAVAVEYKGHYMLILPDGTAYVLDVGNSAFQSYTYYASEKKANRALPWYIWKLGDGSKTALAAASAGDDIRLLLVGDGGIEESGLYTLNGDTDDGEPIACSFTTKLFNFGRGDRYKSIKEMHLRVGGAPDSCVRLSYITEDATYEDVYRIEPVEGDGQYDAGYIRSYRVTPNVNRVRLFGLRCDSDGAMVCEGLEMNYSVQGVIR